jgi:hypothetical protein
MAESPNGPKPPIRTQFWHDIVQEIVSGIASGVALATVGGIAYIVWTVPRQLDLIIRNQEIVLEYKKTSENKFEIIEDSVIKLDKRVTVLESK